MYSMVIWLNQLPDGIRTLQTGCICVISGIGPKPLWNGIFPGTGCCGNILCSWVFVGCGCGQMFRCGRVCERESGWSQSGLGLEKSLWHAGIQGYSKQRPQDHLDLPKLNDGEEPKKRGGKILYPL